MNVAVKGDPDIKITDADRKVWFDAATDLQQLQGKANDAAEMAQIANAQLQQLQNQTPQPDTGAECEAVARRRRQGDGSGAAAPWPGGQGGGGGFGGNTENVRGRIGQLKGAIIGVDERADEHAAPCRSAKSRRPCQWSSSRRTPRPRSCRGW